jgi:hypothetical protein
VSDPVTKLRATSELPALAPSTGAPRLGQIRAIPIEGTVFWLMLDGGPCAGGSRTQRAPANLKAVYELEVDRVLRGEALVDRLADAAADRIPAHLGDRLAPADRAAARNPVGWS